MTESQRPAIPEPGALEIFAGVRPGLLVGLVQRSYADGNVLLASGAEAEKLIVLVWGHVGIHEGGVRIANRDPVCLLGEMAVIDGGSRSASVIAEGDVLTYELEHEDVQALLADPVFLRNLAVELTRKLREATQHRALRYAREEQLFGAFRRFVSPEVLDDLLARGEDGSARQAEVVTLFADIRGFTTKTLAMPPEALFRDLGGFYEVAIRVIHDHGGMVDKLIGDAVMGIWGYNSRADHADRAFEAAAALASEVAALTLDAQPLRIGIGMEMGIVTLGVVGSEGKSSFTAIGPSVNLAARLQSETKRLGTTICLGPVLVGRLSETRRNILTGPSFRDIKGVDEPVQVWSYTPKE